MQSENLSPAPRSKCPLDFFDPHFHIWDVSEAGVHDGKILFEPKPHGAVYRIKEYEADVQCEGALASAGLRHVGGTFVEALSVCYLDEPDISKRCLAEATWASAELAKSELRYALVGSACLEADEAVVAATLEALAADKRVVGIRQIINHAPDWPRNKALGNLLESAAWRRGFALLERYGLSFDMQLNPPQFARAAELIKAHPGIPIIVNHLGTPTLAELQDAAKAKVYFDGLAALADCPNTHIKLSMLCYISADWDKPEHAADKALVVGALRRVVELFGAKRCMFASNFPVDIKDGWPTSRLMPAFLDILRGDGDSGLNLSKEDQQEVMARTAQRVYKVES